MAVFTSKKKANQQNYLICCNNFWNNEVPAIEIFIRVRSWTVLCQYANLPLIFPPPPPPPPSYTNLVNLGTRSHNALRWKVVGDLGTRLQPKLPAPSTWTEADPGVLRGSGGPDPPPRVSPWQLCLIHAFIKLKYENWGLRAGMLIKRQTGSGERENENWELNVTRTLALSFYALFPFFQFPVPRSPFW